MEAADSSGLRLLPLGGLGEFGLNAMVLEWQEHRLLVDCGVLFPSAEQPGVDSIVPDFEYVAGHRDGLHGILLTHGHEDHIGALAFALQAAPAPVYGSRLTNGFARRRLAERGLEADFRTLTPGQPVEVGPFRVHPIRVAHSVIDSLALAIETPAGVVVHSGDFKIGTESRDEEKTDLEALRAWGDRGVLALLSDSTNVEYRGRTGGEDDVIPAFREILEKAPGRVLVTCFATSIPRIQRVAQLAVERGRSIGFVGRRMNENVEVAQELGLLDVPRASILPPEHWRDHPRGDVLLFVSGSQGEPLSALSVISIDEHRDVHVDPGDTVVFSARPIPGNERAVSRVMSNLFRRGCDVLHGGTAHVHVSGHASRDELVDLMRLVRPRYLVPIHGEYRMLAQHARLAVEAGLADAHVVVAEDGEAIAFGPWGARKEGTVPAGRLLLDRSGTEGVEEIVIRDRRHLSSEGIVVPIVALDKQTGVLQGAPEIVTRGFVHVAESAELLADAGRLIEELVATRPPEEAQAPDVLRERMREELRRYFKRRTQRRPMVLPVVMEV
jgi:ribonuclease J